MCVFICVCMSVEGGVRECGRKEGKNERRKEGKNERRKEGNKEGKKEGFITCIS